MSLINDALKRASQSDKKRSAPTALPRLMQPAAAPQRTGSSLLVAGIVVVALVLAVAGWIFWRGFGTAHTVVAVPRVQPAQAVVAAPPPVAVKPAVAVPQSQSAPAPAPAAVVAAPPAESPAPDPWPTNLTVNAIFYSKSNPRALVNGKTVATGDTIDGVLVTGIMSDRVFVDYKGQSKVILMGGQ
jgi:hypothetical protein